MVKYLTSEGLEKLKRELDSLEKTKRKEVSEKIRHAASQGDLKENAGYAAAKEEQAFIEGRIKELKEIVSQAKIVERSKSDKVQIGSFVCLEPTETKAQDSERTFQLVGPEEADILQGKISFKSPLGEAILKKKKGDIVEVDAPDGKKKYEIVEVK